jgi:hypothetical protein
MKTEAGRTSTSTIAELAAAAGVLIVAFYLSTRAGGRGFYAFDQSIVFDGSYRVLSGQVPYRDFLMPFGPVTFWLHAVFFKLLGTTYQAYVAGAGAVNVAATLTAMLIVRLLFPSLRFLPLAGGIVTAVWFYPPFGTPWVDQTAFFFALAAVFVFLKGLLDESDGATRPLLLAASGCLIFLSFLSKQNVGSFMVLLFPLLILADNRSGLRRLRDLGFFALGGAVTAGCFAIWVATSSDTAGFVHYFFEIPRELGVARLSGFADSWGALRWPSPMGRAPALMLATAWGSLAVSVVYLTASPARAARGTPPRPHLLAAVLCIYLAAFQHLFTNTTLNQPENGLAFTGVILAAGVGLLLSLGGLGGIRAGGLIAVAVGVLLLFTSRAGYRVAMRREVHEMLRGADFGDELPIEALKGLRWARPTRLRGYAVTPDHIVRLYRYLEQSGENFFIFPDWTLFYGLVGVPSPQPLLWFHEGVTYRKDDNAELDREIVDALKRNDVRIVVREQAAWFNPGKRLDDFPQLEAFLGGEFRKVGDIGIFRVYEKR